MMKTERSALIAEDARPKYAFETSIARKKRQLRQFQVCLSIMICFAVIILLVTTAISLSSHKANSTTLNNETDRVTLLALPGTLSCNNTLQKHYNNSLFAEALNSVRDDLEHLWKSEGKMPKLGVNTPSYRHQMVTATSAKSNELALIGLQEEFAAKKYYSKGISLTCTNAHVGGDATCVKFSNISCSKYMRYRSFDGVCNNLEHPFEYGVGYRHFRRILQADYEDGISQPRLSKDGNELPSARTISNVIHRPYFRNDPNFTVMLAVWGQFVDHDVTSTASSRSKNGTVISCCGDSNLTHPECFPVKIPAEDHYYGFKNITCMNFVRSAPAPNCCLGPREQMNQVSAYIDGSVVYGLNLDASMKLRSLRHGMLRMFLTPDRRELLPISKDVNDGCNREEQRRLGRYCFMSGDARANENLHLTSMHLIWARHHNSLAKRLVAINKHWNDERVFQESRKILSAQMQHITYNEFLKIVIGEDFAREFDLVPKKNGYYRGYEPNLDATIANSFASSAFRFAHSLIPSLVRFVANDVDEYLRLHEILFDPFALYRDGELDKVIRGAIQTEIQANDAFFTPELKRHLFEEINENANESREVCGLDLVSLNIQRGRDHGLPGYIKWREICNLSVANSFEDLFKDIDAETLNYMKSVYRYVEDIDLYTGSLSEHPVQNSLLGPTLNCLIIDQFIRLKRGDRYWYENPNVFTPTQLREVRKTTLARILCDNSDNVTRIQPSVMVRRGDDDNAEIDCASLQKTNLMAWREEHFPHVVIGNRDMAVGYYN